MTVKQFRDTELTNTGFSVSNKAALGKTQYSTTRAVTTDVDLSSYKTDDLKNLTSLPNEINSGIITDYDMPGNNVSAIKINFNNSNFKDGYVVRAVGMYAKESGSDKEFLHSITVSDSPVYIPAVSGNVFDGFYLTMAIFTGNNKNINIKIADETNATIKYVDDAVSRINTSLTGTVNQINYNLNNVSDTASSAYTMASKANNTANQAQATAYQGLRFMGKVPSDTLSIVQTPGIYDLAGKSYKDFGNKPIWGNFVVIGYGDGVIQQFIYNNVNNCWAQSCNGWGNSGFKSIY